jgi:hypothetical protein
MSTEGIALCLVALLVGMGMAACGPQPTPVPPTDIPTPVPPTDTPTLMPATDTLMPVLSERLVVQIDFSSWIPESFTVSPDSKRVAYGAGMGDKQVVVVDGKEGKQYDNIVVTGGGKIIFDSADSLHYLALKGDEIYLVEERIE